MKVLLLEHPRTISQERCNDIANTPLASCLLSGSIAGVIQDDGHDVSIIEGYLDNLSYQEIEEQVKDVSPGLLGVNMVYHWQGDQEIITFLEKLKKDGVVPYVVVYGYYPTFAYEKILKNCQAVDAVVLGEPELTFAELTASLSRGQKPQDLPGLAVRDSAGVRCRRRELIEDLDSLPFPVRTEAMMRISEVNLQGSRGCYGRCTFCYINPFYGTGSHWRGRSPENIAVEIDEIIAKWEKREFYFTDPNFFGPGERGQRRALRLASLLKERKITFGIEARVNDIHDETIKALVDAGLRNILIGLESGRDESLKRLNKMTTVAQNERALEILRMHGIEPNVGFIMFEPDSNLEDIRTNFEFLKRNHLLENLAITANVLYHHQIILMGTTAFQQLKSEGRLQNVNSFYEGTTPYRDDSVAALADLMRRLTNIVFDRMDGIWSRRVKEPENARERYGKINQLLASRFETALSFLESGQLLTSELRDEQEAKDAAEIDKIMGSK
ncbi:B12-binding domain-containing radical SAM protein [Syntrophaceticus schinkii]|jgi:anaerobic magnesium-protoporphyrin IX monomethyl ester cyclase|uniref:Radical SAM domain protein n=1 Tax=Syntrophaceticus schinkii TaxID=499207 RepID=A0A0B7MFC7_9FIRM|nr:radical SAM protein [Syntrophaceticus schinkii]MDD4675167.1 radical SAM protein [Syntrophaceticus schinkii]CEO88755.1 Radical SAM domain protein [Syntrophaceticus schinkii]